MSLSDQSFMEVHAHGSLQDRKGLASSFHFLYEMKEDGRVITRNPQAPSLRHDSVLWKATCLLVLPPLEIQKWRVPVEPVKRQSTLVLLCKVF